ncbi:hypothetical protein HanXRQr2_Chr12g0548721 [Helianthus annuus]|uniref:Uncharacterized protein n=1 Tax=Helianthus annuus TaxID=4232 RepID=A0A9K3HHN2_HELAN|nr:hypothetical protein HanXRQr2_Chr12g0548721 [Helianthus annuus]KAJ0863284.1 hypothetical protein HanPSC8_Chr12g0528201 [Helianthus annuus]
MAAPKSITAKMHTTAGRLLPKATRVKPQKNNFNVINQNSNKNILFKFIPSIGNLKHWFGLPPLFDS